MSGSGVVAIVQARMSSRRFPGKVLTPFKGLPILEHVLTAVECVLSRQRVILATSSDPSDDPIAAFAARRQTNVVRGDLDNVLDRFQTAARGCDAEWLLRVSADSPLLDPAVLRRVMRSAAADVDVVTTTRPRTFPKGRNAEMVRRQALLAIDAGRATPEEREHVTLFFYNRPTEFRIRNVESGQPQWADLNLAVDTPADLERLERLTAAELSRLSLLP
jgi:spore coat polysaccharide biosynthesis protein SpsF